MQLIRIFNKGMRFLLCVIDVYSKYAWVVTIANVFQKVLDKSDCKPNKIWLDKGSKFYNRSMKLWLKDNDIEMYSINNEGKCVVTKRFIRTLKTKIDKHMTAVSKNVYIDKLDNIVNEYSNAYQLHIGWIIKMKPVDVKDNA